MEQGPAGNPDCPGGGPVATLGTLWTPGPLAPLRDVAMDELRPLLSDPSLEPWQKRHRLASAAEHRHPWVGVTEGNRELFAAGILCGLFEGHAPYRPRYVLPDYARLMTQGSDYLELDPPRDLFEAVSLLLAAWRFVPSITGMPVWLGNLDALLEPFWDTVDPATGRKLLGLMLTQVDRTLPDAFVHANLGPGDSRVAHVLLDLEREAKRAVPNLSLRVGPDTPRALRLAAVACALETGKPWFASEARLSEVQPRPCGLASCYNTLPIGGGSHTLVRLNLARLSQGVSPEAFFATHLPQAVDGLLDALEARIRFLVEETRFFEASWLVREGLLHRDRFTAMAGMVGLAEAVDHLGAGQLGRDAAADDLGLEVIQRLRELVKARPLPYCEGTDGRAGLHAQSGIADDEGVTPGVRIRIGCEPELPVQMRLQARLQAAFDTGVADILTLDPTARRNPEGALKLVEGALATGLQVVGIGAADAEVVRVSGYLIKRRDLARVQAGGPLREESAALGEAAVRHQGVLGRRVRSLG